MAELEDALALKVRHDIYKTIERSPGLHFRELQRRTQTAVGSLQYHLDYLQRSHLVRAFKEGRFTRYYSVRGKQLGEQTTLMSLLRRQSLRRIAIFLLTKKRATNLQIAQELGIAPSTVSWHLGKLMEKEIVEKKRRGRKSYFTLKNPEEVSSLLVGYKRSFLDEAVERFVEIWEEL